MSLQRREQVTKLWALEPSAEMRTLAAERMAASGLALRWRTPEPALALNPSSRACCSLGRVRRNSYTGKGG
jgi:hypothetical protein